MDTFGLPFLLLTTLDVDLWTSPPSFDDLSKDNKMVVYLPQLVLQAWRMHEGDGFLKVRTSIIDYTKNMIYIHSNEVSTL